MNAADDDFWDDLGVAWRAVDIQTASLMPRLQALISKERWRRRVSAIIGTLAGLFGLASSITWITQRSPAAKWLGGAVIMGISVAAIFAVATSLRQAVADGNDSTLIAMLDLTIAQARRKQRDAKFGAVALGILLIFSAFATYVEYSDLHARLGDAILVASFVAMIVVFASVLGYRDAHQTRERLARIELVRHAFLARENAPLDSRQR